MLRAAMAHLAAVNATPMAPQTQAHSQRGLEQLHALETAPRASDPGAHHEHRGNQREAASARGPG